jgi:uncharacterized protein YceK
MRTFVVVLAAAVAIGASGCGATRTTTIQTRAFPTLTSATATFVSTDHGKDADSALTVQLLRSNAELGAEIRTVGTKFDDHSSSAPFAFSLVGPFTKNDIDNGELRLRLTPDGDDDWTFNLHLTMRFSDGTTRNFMWRGIHLDHTNPERVLTLDPARS